jgi:hypothetical protein
VRISRLALAVAALVLAVFPAVLAADVQAWRETLRDDDVRYLAEERPPPGWSTSTRLPARLSRGLLAVGDDVELRRAVTAFRTARRATEGFGTRFVRQRLRENAEIALGDVVNHQGGPQASQAADLLGVLEFVDATSGPRAATPVERSLGSFRNAVRLDPGNVAAKYNLELLLRLLEARGERIGPNPQPGPRASGQRGAGAGTPGRGY